MGDLDIVGDIVKLHIFIIFIIQSKEYFFAYYVSIMHFTNQSSRANDLDFSVCMSVCLSFLPPLSVIYLYIVYVVVWAVSMSFSVCCPVWKCVRTYLYFIATQQADIIAE